MYTGKSPKSRTISYFSFCVCSISTAIGQCEILLEIVSCLVYINKTIAVELRFLLCLMVLLFGCLLVLLWLKLKTSQMFGDWVLVLTLWFKPRLKENSEFPFLPWVTMIIEDWAVVSCFVTMWRGTRKDVIMARHSYVFQHILILILWITPDYMVWDK